MRSSPLTGARVIIVQQALQMGGAERQGLALARHLAGDCGCAVEVWGLSNPGEVMAACEALDIPCRLVPCDWDVPHARQILNLARFARELRRAGPDVVLPYTNPSNVVCGLAWRWTGARTCIWNQRDVDKHPMGPRWERWATRMTPAFVSNSRHGAEFMTRMYGVPSADIHVVYNGVEMHAPQASRHEWRSRLGLDDRDFVACMLANVHEHKDHRTAIRAWQAVVDTLARDHRRAVLVLAGHDYGSGQALHDLAAERGIADAIRWMGHVSDVAGLVDASDLCVFCAWREGVPNGVLECMVRGLPVVGSDIPGIREAVGDNGAQFLVAPEDAAALADRILAFAADDSLRRRAGDMNRRRAREVFDVTRMCRQMEEVIGAALDGSRRRHRRHERPLTSG